MKENSYDNNMNELDEEKVNKMEKASPISKIFL